MPKSVIIVTLLVAIITSFAAHAETGRFVMEETDEGYVRMDTQTGSISICTIENNQLVCKMAADERAALNQDLAKLEDRIIILEKRIENAMPVIEGNELPTEEEFERGLGYMEKFMRRFMGIARELDEPNNKT